MSKITLNFFGEMAKIEKPKNLSSLRNEISKLFCFTPQDTNELLISYNIKNEKKYISNNADLDFFLKSKIPIINIDINQISKIYQDNLNQIEESLKAQKELEILLKKKDELNQMREDTLNKEKKKLIEINSKINDLKKKGLKIKNYIFECLKEFEKKINENNEKIIALQKKLGLPLTIQDKKNPYKKKFFMDKNELKLSNSLNDVDIKIKSETKNKKEIHYYITCDGCQKTSFEGKRYTCKDCNIDYCEECFQIYKETHEHKFEVREKSVFDLVDMNKQNENENSKPYLKYKNYHGKKFNGQPVSKNSSKKIGFCPSKESVFKTSKNIHFGIKCNGCGKYPITGSRFKCSVCSNFDYCKECMKRFSEIHKHRFLEISENK